MNDVDPKLVPCNPLQWLFRRFSRMGANLENATGAPETSSHVHFQQKTRSAKHKNHGVTHHGGRNRPYLPNYWEFDLPPAATTQPRPNAIIRYTASVIAASASANFAPPSPSPQNTNISDSSTSAGRFSTNSASAPTPHLLCFKHLYQ